MTLPPLKPYEQVKEELKTWLQEMDLEITREFDEQDICGFWIKSGDFPVLIENRRPLNYCVVAFQITFSDESIIRTLNGYYEKQDNRFLYWLTRVLTSPQTSFVRVVENGRVIGFTLMRSIYPFHEGFSVHELDEAIQAVVSTGAVGIAFLRSELGAMALDHTPPRPESEPGPLYG
jgi:hypothetical protein